METALVEINYTKFIMPVHDAREVVAILARAVQVEGEYSSDTGYVYKSEDADKKLVLSVTSSTFLTVPSSLTEKELPNIIKKDDDDMPF